MKKINVMILLLLISSIVPVCVNAQFEMPKVGDTWKYKIGQGGYKTEVVTQLLDEHSYILKVMTTRGTSTTTKWKCFSFERDMMNSGSRLFVDVPVNDDGSVDDRYGSHPGEVCLRIPLVIKDTWINQWDRGYSGTMEGVDNVLKYRDSAKVIAGTFHKVWTIQRIYRGVGIQEFYVYSEEVGLIELIDGGGNAVLELVSYKK